MFTPPYRHGVITVEFHEAITQINYFVYWKVKRVVKWLNLIMLCTLAKKLDDMSRFLLPKNLTGRSSFPLNSTQFPTTQRSAVGTQSSQRNYCLWKFTSKCKLKSLLGITRPSPLDPETPRVVQKWPFLLSIMLNMKELWDQNFIDCMIICYSWHPCSVISNGKNS